MCANTFVIEELCIRGKANGKQGMKFSSSSMAAPLKLLEIREISPRLETRREISRNLFSRPRRDREFRKMFFRDRDETETRNLDREIREIETETRISLKTFANQWYLIAGITSKSCSFS